MGGEKAIVDCRDNGEEGDFLFRGLVLLRKERRREAVPDGLDVKGKEKFNR